MGRAARMEEACVGMHTEKVNWQETTAVET
jgi:hypothetical protein